MTLEHGIISVPFRLSVLPTLPLDESIVQGFLFVAQKSTNWYAVHQSPRNGKLLATWTTLRKNLRCSHRSDDYAVLAAKSCVGLHRRDCRDVAEQPRRLSGRLAADRLAQKWVRLTIAYVSLVLHKTWLCLPATKWVTRRKAKCLTERTTQTKDLRFGSTERAVCGSLTHSSIGHRTNTAGQHGYVTRYGGGAQLLSRFPFFQLVITDISSPLTPALAASEEWSK